jgi:indole-3-pyruvate monooxygenase
LKQTDTLIIGASISGLASAACLHKEGIEYTIIERKDRVATPWRHHYDRLHLHTNKRYSHLPYKKFPMDIPRYPARQEVITYLEDYQKYFDIRPLFGIEALTIKRESDYWITETNKEVFKSNYLIMATGAFTRPRRVDFKGMESFPGKILHSANYKTGKDFRDQNVLVVGFGNSACEIAIDLYEQGAKASMSVRSPVNVIPRDVLGIPVVQLSLLLSPLPPRVADIISEPLMWLLVGDLTKLGLQKMPYGPLEEIRRDRNAPVLDIGTIKLIRQGHIKIYDEIDHIQDKTVHFSSGRKEDFDAIIAGIGYDREEEILPFDKRRWEDLQWPVDKQKYFGKDGLYFCGYWISPTGQIREISLDAKKIAKHIAKNKIR